MEYQSYLMRIIGPNIDEYPNKHCKDDEAALDLALAMVARYPLNTRISVYHVIDVDGREHRQYIGMVEHVVRRTM